MDYFTPFWEGFRSIARRVLRSASGASAGRLKHEHSQPPRAARGDRLPEPVCRVRRARASSWLPVLWPLRPCPSLSSVQAAPPSGLASCTWPTRPSAQAYEEMSRAACSSRRTHRRLGETDNQIPSGDEGAMERVLDRYRACDLVLSSRLHGCILGLALGRKVLAVSGDWKVESFMSAAGLDEWVLDRDRPAPLLRRLEALEGQVAPRAFSRRPRARTSASPRSAGSVPARSRSAVGGARPARRRSPTMKASDLHDRAYRWAAWRGTTASTPWDSNAWASRSTLWTPDWIL
jgi:hypothetical protein